MEKRETGLGDTVNLEKVGLVSADLVSGMVTGVVEGLDSDLELDLGGGGGGESGVLEEVGSGSREKSSSHSYPVLSSETFPSEESSEALMREP